MSKLILLLFIYPYPKTHFSFLLNQAYIVAGKCFLIDTMGNNDGRVNPGEEIEIELYAKNTGDTTAYNVKGIVSSPNPEVTIVPLISSYGNISPGDSAKGIPSYKIKVSENAKGGERIVLEFNFSWDSVYSSQWRKEFIVFGPEIGMYRYRVHDEDSDSLWESGEQAEIVITLLNTGNEPAHNIIGILRTSSPYITINDSICNFGNCDPGDTASNSLTPFIATSAFNTPIGHRAYFSLHLYTQENYNEEIKFKVILPYKGERCVNHDRGGILLTLTPFGSISFTSSNQFEGYGCQYPIGSGNNQLYYGSFAIGIEYPYVIDNYYESYPRDDKDWRREAGIYKFLFHSPLPEFDEYTLAIYNDSYGEFSKGIECIQEGFALHSLFEDDFVIIRFTLENKSKENIENLYAGLFLDWDVEDYSTNKGGVDEIRAMAYVYDSVSSIYMGSAFIDPPRHHSWLIANVSIIDNADYVWPYGGLPDSIEMKFLNGTYSFQNADSASDWSTCLSAGPFDIPIGSHISVAFVIAGGHSLSELQEAVDTAYLIWWATKVRENSKEKNKRLKFSINYKELKLFLTLPEGQLEIFNPIGQRIKKIKRNNLRINFRDFPAGIYFVRVKANKVIYKNKIMVIK